MAHNIGSIALLIPRTRTGKLLLWSAGACSRFELTGQAPAPKAAASRRTPEAERSWRLHTTGADGSSFAAGRVLRGLWYQRSKPCCQRSLP